MKTLLITGFCLLCASAQADIKIAVAGPHSGAYAALGAQFWLGANRAADEINQLGGINGETIVLVKADDACEPAKAQALAQELVQDEELNAVLGHLCSSSSIPASVLYDEANLLMVSPGSTNPLLTERELKGVLRTIGRDDQQGEVAADFMVNNLQSKRIVILHGEDKYGAGLAAAVVERLRAQSVEPLSTQTIAPESTDYASVAEQVLQLRADAVYFGGLHLEAGALLRALKDADYTGAFLAGNSVVNDEFIAVAGGLPFVENVYTTFNLEASDVPAAQRVVSSLRSEGHDPKGYTLRAYAGLQVIAAALRARGKRGGATLASWLKAVPIPTVMGILEFDAQGDLKAPDYQMHKWDANGNYVLAN